MGDLMELAERCEKATGPELAIDFDIAEFVTRAHMATGKAPKYTASLDAAMTLVPDGWRWAIWDSGAYAVVTSTDEEHESRGAQGSTPALALCAAALKARANALLGDGVGK